MSCLPVRKVDEVGTGGRSEGSRDHRSETVTGRPLTGSACLPGSTESRHRYPVDLLGARSLSLKNRPETFTERRVSSPHPHSSVWRSREVVQVSPVHVLAAALGVSAPLLATPACRPACRRSEWESLVPGCRDSRLDPLPSRSTFRRPGPSRPSSAAPPAPRVPRRLTPSARVVDPDPARGPLAPHSGSPGVLGGRHSRSGRTGSRGATPKRSGPFVCPIPPPPPISSVPLWPSVQD